MARYTIDPNKVLSGAALEAAEARLKARENAAGILSGPQNKVTYYQRDRPNLMTAVQLPLSVTHGFQGEVIESARKSGLIDIDGQLTDEGRAAGLDQEMFDDALDRGSK